MLEPVALKGLFITFFFSIDYFGWTATGVGLLVWDLLNIGKGEMRIAELIAQKE